MSKATVQSLMLDQIKELNKKMDMLIPVVEGLKVKAAIAGGVAGIVGTSLMSLVVSLMK